MQVWAGGKLNAWRMWGLTWKTKYRWWFIGVSRQFKDVNAALDDALANDAQREIDTSAGVLSNN